MKNHVNPVSMFSSELFMSEDQANYMNEVSNFSKEEVSIYRRLNNPEKVQYFLDYDLNYSKEEGVDTCCSPRRVLSERRAHCAEGAIFAAAALRFHGHEPLIVDLEAVRDDDHLLAVFKEHNHWGAIAKSNYAGLRYREPVYRTIRELVMSYFDHYYNPRGEKTLRAFSKPVSLKRFDHLNWMTTNEDLWEICDYFSALPHSRIMTLQMERKRRRMDRRLYDAGFVGAVR